MKRMLVLLVSLSLMCACSLKRANPVDPHASGIEVPNSVSNLVVSHSPANSGTYWAELSWTKIDTAHADGYYIYRGMSYNGTYERMIQFPNNEDQGTTLIWRDNSVVPNDYYYKISAYKNYGDNELEGRISPWVYVRVPK